MNHTQVETLASKYLDDSISESEIRELESALSADDALGCYLDCVALETLLDEGSASDVPLTTRRAARAGGRTWLAWTAIAASLLIGVVWWSGGAWQGDVEPRVATQQQIDVLRPSQLEHADKTLVSEGDSLPFTLPSGVEVEVIGPAEFRVASENRIVLNSGALTANVPEQARGFQVVTPNGDVVDLGTRIGVAVDSAHTELHVFEGKAEVVLDESQVLASLDAHEAVRVHSPENAGYEPIDINPALFRQERPERAPRIEFGFDTGQPAWTATATGSFRDRGDRPATKLTAGEARFQQLEGWVDLPTVETQVGAFFDNLSVFAPHSGAGRVLPLPYHCRESLESLRLTSPPFRLARGGGSIFAFLTGGRGAAEAPPAAVSELPAESSDRGFMGLALRRVSDGRFLCSVRRPPGNFYEWVRVELAEEQLTKATAQDAEDETYVLDLIDTYRGPEWSWIGLDSVSVPGSLSER